MSGAYRGVMFSRESLCACFRAVCASWLSCFLCGTNNGNEMRKNNPMLPFQASQPLPTFARDAMVQLFQG
jgi:hypothetical protein